MACMALDKVSMKIKDFFYFSKNSCCGSHQEYLTASVLVEKWLCGSRKNVNIFG